MLRHRVPLILALVLLGAGTPQRRTTLASSSSWSNSYSVDFDGTDDHVTIGEPSDLNLNPQTQQITISAWIKQTDLLAQHYVVAKARPFVPSMVFVLGAHTDSTLFGYFGTSPSTSGGVVGTATWRHAAITNGPDSCSTGLCGRVWLNGAQVGGNVISATGSIPGIDWLIGAARNANNSDTAQPFKGNIDEVSFWSVALSSSEIAALYNGGRPANPALHSRSGNLIHYYRMGDGDTYPTISDVVGTADGTMSSMASNDIEADVP